MAMSWTRLKVDLAPSAVWKLRFASGLGNRCGRVIGFMP